MNDTFWQILWLVILGSGLIGMAGLLLAVGTGSVRELRQSLDELKSGGESGESSEVSECPPTADVSATGLLRSASLGYRNRHVGRK